MKYCSTRGGESNLSFRDVLFAGYAKDEGLYMPEIIPQLSTQELENLSSLSYPDLVFEVAKRFISPDEIPVNDLKELIATSFSRFSEPEIVKMKRLSGSLNIAELFHGPTLAFKDLALSVVSGLLNYYLKKSKKYITILVGTSGDTGSAAIESVKGSSNMDIIVLLPHGHCTHTQELQMTTVIDHNIYIYCVEGTSDELDEPIKRCFNDEVYVSDHNLISINSINWGRILVQIAHYFYCYYELCRNVGDQVEIIVPTGAAGNITAGCISQRMGLPIKLIAAVNRNDIVGRSLSCGDMSVKGDVLKSLAPAMDIQMAYNMERLLHHFTNGSGTQVKDIMQKFEKDGSVVLPSNFMELLKKVVVETFVVNDLLIKDTMKRVYDENKYVICPHTATAVAYHYERGAGLTPRGCLATAAPDKFPEAVREAGIEAKLGLLSHLDSLPTKHMWMRKGEDWDEILREMIGQISERRKV